MVHPCVLCIVLCIVTTVTTYTVVMELAACPSWDNIYSTLPPSPLLLHQMMMIQGFIHHWIGAMKNATEKNSIMIKSWGFKNPTCTVVVVRCCSHIMSDAGDWSYTPHLTWYVNSTYLQNNLKSCWFIQPEYACDTDDVATVDTASKRLAECQIAEKQSAACVCVCAWIKPSASWESKNIAP